MLGIVLIDGHQARVGSVAAHLPASAAGPARDALPDALAIADKLGGPKGAALASQPQAAFVDGLGLAMVIAATSIAAATLVFGGRRARSQTRRAGAKASARHQTSVGRRARAVPKSTRQATALRTC